MQGRRLVMGAIAATTPSFVTSPSARAARTIAPHRRLGLGVVRLAMIALGGCAASFALWDPLDIDERAHIRRLTQQSAESVRADLAADMQALLGEQALLARWWAARDPLSRRDWEISSKMFVELHPSFLVVQWVDPTHHVLWGVSRDGQDGAKVLGQATLNPGLDAALHGTGGEPVVSPVFPLPGGRTAARVIVPVRKGDALAGFLVGVFDIKDEIDRMMADHSDLGYSVSLAEGSKVIYETGRTGHDSDRTWAQELPLPLPGIEWRLRLWPKHELLADMRSPLPELALVLGGLLGLSLVLTVHFGRAAQHRSRELARAHAEVERRVKERTADLRLANESLGVEVIERGRAEDALQNLSGRLLRLQDEERRRIARELHDSTAQLLGAVAIGLEKALSLLPSGTGANGRGVLRESAELLERATAEIRTLSFLLHPPMLDDLGLEYVLPWYAEGFTKRSGIAVDVDVASDLGRLPGNVELTLFRIAQEALTNVRRHSESPTASITLFRDCRSVTLEIADRGCGIAPGVQDPAAGRGAALGVGIAGMRERVRQLGGQLEIAGNRHGTSVRAVLPLAPGKVGHAAAGPGLGGGTPGEPDDASICVAACALGHSRSNCPCPWMTGLSGGRDGSNVDAGATGLSGR